jgi:aryl-alcohol dehydrogenase-like predicted oxidoreductase
MYPLCVRQDGKLQANLAIVETVEQIAAEKQVTLAQVALAWLCAQGDDIVPFPGTKRRRYLQENIGALTCV